MVKHILSLNQSQNANESSKSESRKIAFLPDLQMTRGQPWTSPGSAEAHSDDAGGVVAFFDRIYVVWRGWVSPLFVPGIALCLGGLKRRNTHFCFWPPTCFGTSPASGAMGAVWQHKGSISEYVTDYEAAEKHLHAPATSSDDASASNNVAGAWKCFSATSMLAMWRVGW